LAGRASQVRKEGHDPRQMRVALVALPWAAVDLPSSALGVLAAYLRKRRPDDLVEPFYEYVDIAARLGFDLYRKIAGNAYLLGEPLYAPLLYPSRRESTRAQFDQLASRELSDSDPAAFGRQSWSLLFDRILPE